MRLPLKDRPDAQKRAAHAAVTTAQTNGDKIVRYELETGIAELLSGREPPITLNHSQIHFADNIRKQFVNYTHKIATAIWRKDPDNLDILTEDEALAAWIDRNQPIQKVLSGFQRARAIRDSFVGLVDTGGTADMSEDELQARVDAIRSRVPVPTDEVNCLACNCKKKKG